MSSTIALMMLAQPAAAATITYAVEDPLGDLGFGIDPKTGGVMQTWGDNTPVVKAGFLDMALTWLSQKGKTYTFGMEMGAALPEAGSPLPGGMKVVEWAVWIDPSAFNIIIDPCVPLYLIALRYDGSAYEAFLLDYATMEKTPIGFSIDGAKLQLQFTAADIGNLVIQWWSPLVREWTGPVGTSGYWFVDAVNLPLVDGYAYIDLPWPPA